MSEISRDYGCMAVGSFSTWVQDNFQQPVRSTVGCKAVSEKAVRSTLGCMGKKGGS